MSGLSKVLRGRRSNSTFSALIDSLVEGRLGRLPTSIVVGGVTVATTATLLSFVRGELKRRSAYHDSGTQTYIRVAEKRYRLVPSKREGHMEFEEYLGQSFDGVDLVNHKDLPSSAELIGHLRPYVLYRERNYTLLMTIVQRATQWVNALPDDYAIKRQDRWRLIPGSVALAMEVTEEEEAGMLHMQATDPYSKTRGWNKGIPKPTWKAILLGPSSMTVLARVFWGMFGVGIGPKTT